MTAELQLADPVATRGRLREAMEGRDPDAFAAACAPDVSFHSPILGRPPFEGRGAVRDLTAAVLATFDFEYTFEADSGAVQALGFHARVRGMEVDGVELITIDDTGQVTDIKAHIRPMAGLAAVAAALGPHLARGPVQRVLVTVFTVPLMHLLRFAEPLIPRLIRMRG
ncbi:MAG: nuclear transport factor 2 family protein [Thermoleophilaceae bacterium]